MTRVPAIVLIGVLVACSRKEAPPPPKAEPPTASVPAEPPRTPNPTLARQILMQYRNKTRPGSAPGKIRLSLEILNNSLDNITWVSGHVLITTESGFRAIEPFEIGTKLLSGAYKQTEIEINQTWDASDNIASAAFTRDDAQ